VRSLVDTAEAASTQAEHFVESVEILHAKNGGGKTKKLGSSDKLVGKNIAKLS